MLGPVLATLTAPTLVARGMLRDASHFDWSTIMFLAIVVYIYTVCLLYTSPSPRDRTRSRMPSSA